MVEAVLLEEPAHVEVDARLHFRFMKNEGGGDPDIDGVTWKILPNINNVNYWLTTPFSSEEDRTKRS